MCSNPENHNKRKLSRLELMSAAFASPQYKAGHILFIAGDITLKSEGNLFVA